jgi:hypothetical protein
VCGAQDKRLHTLPIELREVQEMIDPAIMKNLIT